MVSRHIAEGVRAHSTHRSTVHIDIRDVVARGRSDGVGLVATAHHIGSANRRDGTAVAGSSGDDILVLGEGSRQGVVSRQSRELVAGNSTHVHTVHHDVDDTVTRSRRDGEDRRLTIVVGRRARRDRTVGRRGDRHRVLVRSKRSGNGVVNSVGTREVEGVGVGGQGISLREGGGNTIDGHRGDVVTLVGRNRVNTLVVVMVSGNTHRGDITVSTAGSRHIVVHRGESHFIVVVTENVGQNIREGGFRIRNSHRNIVAQHAGNAITRGRSSGEGVGVGRIIDEGGTRRNHARTITVGGDSVDVRGEHNHHILLFRDVGELVSLNSTVVDTIDGHALDVIADSRNDGGHNGRTIIHVTAEVSRNRRVGVGDIGVLNHTVSVNRVEETHSVDSERSQDRLVVVDIGQIIGVGVTRSGSVRKHIHGTGKRVVAVVLVVAHQEAAQMIVRIDVEGQRGAAAIRQSLRSSRHELAELSVGVHILAHNHIGGGESSIHRSVGGHVVKRVIEDIAVAVVFAHHLNAIHGDGSHVITDCRQEVDSIVAARSHRCSAVRNGSTIGTRAHSNRDGRSNVEVVEGHTHTTSNGSGLHNDVVNTADTIVENIVNVIVNCRVRESLMLVDDCPVGRSRRRSHINGHILRQHAKGVVVIGNHILAGRNVDTRGDYIGSSIVVVAESICRRAIHHGPHQRIGIAGIGNPTTLTHHDIGEVLGIRQGERSDEVDVVQSDSIVGRVAIAAISKRHRDGVDRIREVGVLCEGEGGLLTRSESRRDEGLRHRSTTVDGVTCIEGSNCSRGVVVLHREGDRHVAQIAIVADALNTDEVEVTGENSLINFNVINVSITIGTRMAGFFFFIH